MDKIMTKLLEAVSGVSSPFSLTAFAIAALVIALMLYKGKKLPVGLWVVAICAVVALVLVPVLVQSRGVYRLRVTVVDPREVPVEDAQVWSSLGGEPKKISGGWQFDVPAGSVPPDGKLVVYAAIRSAFLTGQQSVALRDDYNPTTTIKLSADSSARVLGIVVDSDGKGLVGVSVSVAGHSAEAVVTTDGGSFDLPAHAADGQQVYLHAEKVGFRGESLWHPAGSTPARIELTAAAKSRR